MAHLSLNQYLQRVEDAWQNRDGTTLSEYLSFRHPHVASSKLQVSNPEAAVEKIVEPPLDEIVSAHLRCVTAVNNQEFMPAYNYQTGMVQAVTKLLQSQRDQNWALPVMCAACLDLRMIAVQADKQVTHRSVESPMEIFEKTAECLMGCFRICAADNRSTEISTKRWGMLPLVNQLFKVYFRINKLHLCKPLIRAIESSPLKDNFSLSQQITYKYYVGRKAMFDSDFKSADTYLSFAFEKCHKKCVRNKRLILIYLVPVKMLLGYMPKKKVLAKYDLLQFWELVEAIRSGNIRQANKVIQQHQFFFIKCGIYLILEKLKVIAYRNLFKRVHFMLDTHQIPLEALLIALKIMGTDDIDLEEIQCIVANLIAEKKIKGYLSYSHKKLVVSKHMPFPALSSIV
ncbi:PCI domain-containing protein 2 [Schistocerca nitens]|uniref:PCI domain-containing protein 2 n=1 Tax=Schistocerca cancellata TaxID=274614 RepID=UPI002117E0EE|nr:PCI domain-containing protein 2 [Schistocerca cancellata]XP_049802894.1 PCI domain-containing protein 2 [Schistocerca nitens]